MKTKGVMKKIYPLLLLMGLLVSCGSSHNQEELANDVNNMCKCYLDGKDDSRKYMECADRNEKVRNKYKDDNDVLTDYDTRLTDCMSGN